MVAIDFVYEDGSWSVSSRFSGFARFLGPLEKTLAFGMKDCKEFATRTRR
jgi:hypothetical protein